jgi:hypothetical protein
MTASIVAMRIGFEIRQELDGEERITVILCSAPHGQLGSGRACADQPLEYREALLKWLLEGDASTFSIPNRRCSPRPGRDSDLH